VRGVASQLGASVNTYREGAASVSIASETIADQLAKRSTLSSWDLREPIHRSDAGTHFRPLKRRSRVDVESILNRRRFIDADSYGSIVVGIDN